jgi:hypothetical protein
MPMEYRKLRVVWLVMCVPISMLLVWLKEVSYPKFEKMVLPSAGILIALAVLPWLHWRSNWMPILITTTLVAMVLALTVWATH